MTDLDYRPCVGIVVFDRRGKVWLGQRIGALPPYNWQFPQGGVDAGEDLTTAALRELHEETGMSSVEYLGQTAGWILYDFPPEVMASGGGRGFKGQKQVWFAYRFVGSDQEVNLDAHHPPEFEVWRWADPSEASQGVVAFKRTVYDQVLQAFANHALSSDP